MDISMDDMLAKLNKFNLKVWVNEPQDVNTIREIKKPPMGNMPCVLYANFNLFWLGEGLQVWRAIAKERKFEIDVLSNILSELLKRHITRLSKWGMQDTIEILYALQLFFQRRIVQNHGDLVKILDAAMIALNRVQNWIDAIIPWPEMDQKLSGLRRVQ
jgi:hypothetical protein